MAFTDPQSITVDGTANSLPRILTGTSTGRFLSPDARIELTVDPRGSKSRRRNVARVYTRRSVADPVVPTAQVTVQSMVSLTIDRPLTGTTDADIEKDAAALVKWLTDGTNANLKKLIAGEN